MKTVYAFMFDGPKKSGNKVNSIESDAQEWFDLNAEEMTTAEHYFPKFSELAFSFSQF